MRLFRFLAIASLVSLVLTELCFAAPKEKLNGWTVFDKGSSSVAALTPTVSRDSSGVLHVVYEQLQFKGKSSSKFVYKQILSDGTIPTDKQLLSLSPLKSVSCFTSTIASDQQPLVFAVGDTSESSSALVSYKRQIDGTWTSSLLESFGKKSPNRKCDSISTSLDPVSSVRTIVWNPGSVVALKVGDAQTVSIPLPNFLGGLLAAVIGVDVPLAKNLIFFSVTDLQKEFFSIKNQYLVLGENSTVPLPLGAKQDTGVSFTPQLSGPVVANGGGAGKLVFPQIGVKGKTSEFSVVNTTDTSVRTVTTVKSVGDKRFKIFSAPSGRIFASIMSVTNRGFWAASFSIWLSDAEVTAFTKKTTFSTPVFVSNYAYYPNIVANGDTGPLDILLMIDGRIYYRRVNQ